jgi:ribonucleoside-diphosphate reductase alpha chain
MRIPRHFTTAGHDPYEGVEFAERESKIVNPDGSAVFAATGLQMPAAWSQVAVDIMAQKYFRKRGVPSALRHVWEADVPPWLWPSLPEANADDNGGETDAREVFHRLAGTWAYWGWKHGYFDSEQDAAAFYDELCYMLATQRAAPNSPQWFNTGLHWAYGISGPAQGHWYVEPRSGDLRASTSAYERPQPHACFIQSVSDDLVNEGGIMDLWTREARIFKYGSGTGSNFSRLRGENEPLSGGGKSSGLMSFLKIGDRAAGAIKSGGTTRRAAKMVIVNADHPDVEQFIEWKVLEEQKVASLVAGSKVTRRSLRAILDAAQDGIDPLGNRGLRRAVARARRDGVSEAYIQRALQLAANGDFELNFREFDADWQGEAYLTVSGQNSNNSVRVTDEFLSAVRNDGDWSLIRRTDGSVEKVVKARALWDRIANAAWQSADPGLQYDTTINEWHTSPAGGRIDGSNPCSEYMFLDDTACNLASLNLLAFYDEERMVFDVDAYEHASRLWTVVLEISVLMAQYPSRAIAQLSYDYRTLGLGYANLGALLMVQGIPYDSPEALAQTGALTAILTGVAYATSAEMAAQLGPFPRYHVNRAAMLRVIRNHRRAAYDEPRDQYEGLTTLPLAIDQALCPSDLLTAAHRAWDRALLLGEQHGYRNAQASLIAPTGTIGLLMDCDTTGVEPDFALVKFKKLAGGGYFRIINQSVPGALARLGYTPEQSEAIVAYCAGTGTLTGAPGVNREALATRGFTADLLDRIDAALPSAFDITFAFNKYALGVDFCRDALGFSNEQLADPSFSVLEGLGFTRAQIEEANDAIVGRMTVEGAPHLRPEHYAVFDCANRCGKYGTRYIAPMAHVRMLAAAQPFISGAISKTINMPFDATVQDVADVYMAAAESMVKAVALYRDGSKLSQPLSAVHFDDLDDEDIDAAEGLGAVQSAAVAHPAGRAAEELVRGLQRGAREKLPARRRGYAQKAKVGGHSIYLHTGEFADRDGDPRLGEIFVSMSKEGAAFGSLMNCFAIAVSIGLQHGVPLSAYVDSFIFQKFEPNGMVVGHDRIHMATSIIDYIFRELAVTYLGRDDLAHFGPVEDNDPVADDEALESPTPVTPSAAFGFDSGDGDVPPAPEPVAARASQAQANTSARPEPAEGRQPPVAAAPAPQLGSGTPAAAVIELRTPTDRRAEARLKGYEGDPCDECGQLMMVRNGTCLKCLNCGATSGCS